jgi:hypothetical protein
MQRSLSSLLEVPSHALNFWYSFLLAVQRRGSTVISRYHASLLRWLEIDSDAALNCSTVFTSFACCKALAVMSALQEVG